MANTTTSVSHKLRTLRKRQAWLAEKIKENTCSDGVLGWYCDEYNAIEFACRVIELILYKGGFREDDSPTGDQGDA